MKLCPKCKSSNTEEVKIKNTKGLVCNNCGYDETINIPEERTTQREKRKYTPYKKGGSLRTKK